MLSATAMPHLEGHTATTVGDFLIVYGGKCAPMTLNGDVFALNLSTNTWNRLLVSGEAPIPRAYHTACRHGRQLLIFGGIVSVGVDDIHHNTYNMFANVDALPASALSKAGQDRLKDPMEIRYVTQQRLESRYLHCLSLEGTPSWHAVATHGVSPPTRAHHVSCIYRDTMFVFGGYSCHVSGRLSDEEYKALGVVFGLNLTTKTWTAYDTSASPPKLFGMSACVYGGNWIIQGGVDVAQRSETNETWIFSLELGRWKQVHHRVVPPMAFSSAEVFGDTLYLVGGSSDKSTRFYPHVYCFDLLKGVWWHKLLPEDEGLGAHCKATLTVCGNRLILVGGLHPSFERNEAVFAFSPIGGAWEEVHCRFDTALLDNTRGLTNQLERGAAAPFAVGATVAKLKVSQGAQTGTDRFDSQPTSMMSVGLGASPLGESRPNKYVSSNVWASAEDNDALFGITQSLERRRADARGLQRSLELQTVSSAQTNAMTGDAKGSTTTMVIDGRAASIQQDVEMRLSRLRDIVSTTGRPDMQAAVHEHWQSELAQLGQEHQRWREAASLDKDLIRSAVTHMEEDAMPRPSMFQTSPQRHIADSVRIQSFVRGGFVSPSIQRLGLVGELERRRSGK